MVINNMSCWILFLVGALIAFHQAESAGVFELRVLSFDNEAGKNDMGKCCTGKMGANSECDGLCRPRFLVCLKEYQVKIDASSPCTFGNSITHELETNPSADQPQNGYDVYVRLPFPFTWPGTFSLVVEAWHGNQTSHSAVLISRLTRQRWLDVSENWTEDIHSSKYSTIKVEYRVTCEANYYGKGCENLCRPRDDQFGHYSCSPTGERICLTGWTGDYCTKARCLPGCDEQHGHCTKPNECRCLSGWEGPLCNQCQRYPGCMHGTCVKPWDCLCNEGWGGLFCNQDLNFCTNHKPCRNGGTCFNTGQGSYTCSCPSGYTGTNCESPMHECSKTSCLNGGSCVQQTNTTYNICICPRGYSGPRCETSQKTCEKDELCRNGGTCIDLDNGGYKCECRQGFGGDNCQHSTSSCQPNPCKNDGNCVEIGNGGYQCICPTGFTGEKCETNIDDCLGNPCENGGTCVDKINEFRCQCVPGFVGPLCQNRVDYCIAKPCANGGTCLQLINDYKCKCAPGFIGKDCSEEIDECQFQPCQHGGTCVNRVHGYECRCPSGFSGQQCEQVSSSAAPSARVSSESNLTTEHVVVIATISTFVPLVVLVAVGVIICLKQRRKREKARADEEARLQNEQNTANSSFAKRGGSASVVMSADTHMIKNSWGKCTNNVIGPRASALLAAKLHEPDYEQHIKRLSVMSNASAVCGSSEPPLLKRPVEKESNGVYVIEEHFHRPDAISSTGLFATEV